MKKSKFVAMVLSLIGILTLGIGMCMCLLPEWNMFRQGIVVGCIGILVLFIMVLIYWRMEHKRPLLITWKGIVALVAAICGFLTFGTGMCLTMVFDKLFAGIITGAIGILILVCLVPIYKGIKN